MPSADAFAKAFRLLKGISIESGVLIKDMKIGHESIEMYKEYNFPITVEITVKKQIESNELGVEALAAFRNYLEKSGGESGRIVYTRYGNPYDCSFGEISVDSVSGNVVTLKSLGTGIRRYDIPSKGRKRKRVYKQVEVDK